MPERSDLDRRLRAVERALTDGDHDVAALEDAAAITDRLDDLEARIAALEERADELDAATQAVRGYVGNVRAVNDDVADRADAALAAVDRLESRLDGTSGEPTPAPDHASTGDRDEPASRNGSTASSERRGSNPLAGDGYGIEMPAAGADGTEATEPRTGRRGGTATGTSGSSEPATNGAHTDGHRGDDADRSVIDRVREVL